MSSDTFSTALPHLLPHTKTSKPQLYTHLAYLLTQYSTGLSLPITLDSLDNNVSAPAKPFIEATIVYTHHSPTIHICISHNRFLAFFPPSHYPTLPSCTVLRLPPTNSPDALSLAQTLVPAYRITQAILPTHNLAIRLPFPHKLPLPQSSYTLLTIWQNRDLTPPAVYANLVQTQPKQSSLILVDKSPNSPSVSLKLSQAREALLTILPVPCILLVTTPSVTPTENSFILHDTPLSTFFYQPLPNLNNKRKRPEPSTDTLYSSRHLVDLQRHLHHPITVHMRVEKVQPGSDTSVCTRENLCINVPPADYQQGDELLLNHVTYAKHWQAEYVTNVSTMQGVLHCPFVRKLVSINHAIALCRGGYTTAHIKVIVQHAVKQGELVKLSVVDCVKPAESGGVYMKERGFDQLFALSRQRFLELDTHIVEAQVRRIESVVWLMTVTCGVADLPVLTACLST